MLPTKYITLRIISTLVFCEASDSFSFFMPSQYCQESFSVSYCAIEIASVFFAGPCVYISDTNCQIASIFCAFDTNLRH